MISRGLYTCAAVLLLWLPSISRNSDTPPVTEPAPQFQTTGAFAALLVPDLDASATWYQRHLGLHLVRIAKAPTRPARTAVLEGNGLILEIIESADFRSAESILLEAKDKLVLHGIGKIGIRLAPAEFDAMRAFLERRRADFVGGILEDQDLRARTFIVRDNNGNRVQFFTSVSD